MWFSNPPTVAASEVYAALSSGRSISVGVAGLLVPERLTFRTLFVVWLFLVLASVGGSPKSHTTRKSAPRIPTSMRSRYVTATTKDAMLKA